MSLQRRLLLYLLISAPLVWALALSISITRARHEVNELYDTELVRLARQIHSTLDRSSMDSTAALPAAPVEGSKDAGESDVRDLAVALWDAQGRLLLADREGALLPYHADASGFVDEVVNGNLWRTYYLQSFDGSSLVAAGQRAKERDDLVYSLTLTQVVPWMLVLPLLLAAMAWAVRRALSPMRHLAAELQDRAPENLKPIRDEKAPVELKPLLAAMNGLFKRIEQLLVRERRFTADAAHELRTPLAVLRAQWDVVRRSAAGPEREAAEEKFEAGMERMGRLVTQMLSLSRVEVGAVPTDATDVDWHRVVEHAVNDCLSLANRRQIDIACDWPDEGVHPLPVLGDENLLVVLLRNVLDNAVRYAPPTSTVLMRFTRDALVVENDGPPLTADQLMRIGERFYRPEGQAEIGSGLGVSIARRVAELHGLSLSFDRRQDGSGVRVTLQSAPAGRRAPG